MASRTTVLVLMAGVVFLLPSGCTPAQPGAERGAESNAPVWGPPPARLTTQYPIVIVHGALVTSQTGGTAAIAADLAAQGHQVYVAEVPPIEGSEERAAVLAGQVDEALARFGATHVNLLAHSQGGLDARVLASPSGLGYGDRIAAIVTVGTCHQGTALADVALSPTDVAYQTLSRVLALASRVGVSLPISIDDVGAPGRRSMVSQSESNAATFNAIYLDDPRVDYQSWAGVSRAPGASELASALEEARCGDGWRSGPFAHSRRPDAMFWPFVPLGGIVGHGDAAEPNDGMIAVQNAKWGLFRGCLPADHLDEVNQLQIDRDTGFDHVRFWRTLAADLAERGF